MACLLNTGGLIGVERRASLLWVQAGEDGVRKQFHFWPSDQGLMAWDVDGLIKLSRDFPRVWVPLDSISELDQVYWFDDYEQQPTCRKVLQHVRLIGEVDLAHPIILSADGRVMDGMHRVAKALLEGLDSVEAVRFETDPEPDYIGRKPSELPY